MENVVIVLVVSLCVGLAIRTIRKAGKNGAKCIGCPHCKSCSSGKNRSC